MGTISLPANFGTVSTLKVAINRTLDPENFSGAALVTATNTGSSTVYRLALYVIPAGTKAIKPVASWTDYRTTQVDAPIVDLAYFYNYGLVAYIQYPDTNIFSVCRFLFSGSTPQILDVNPTITANFVQNITLPNPLTAIYFDPYYPLMYTADANGLISTYNITNPTNIATISVFPSSVLVSGAKGMLAVGNNLFLANLKCRAGCEGLTTSASFGNGAPQAIDLSPNPSVWSISSGYGQAYYRMCVSSYVMEAHNRFFTALASPTIPANGSALALTSGAPYINSLVSSSLMYDAVVVDNYILFSDVTKGLRLFLISNSTTASTLYPFQYNITEQTILYNGSPMSTLADRPKALVFVFDRLYYLVPSTNTFVTLRMSTTNDGFWDDATTILNVDITTENDDFQSHANRSSVPPPLQFTPSLPLVIDAYQLPPISASQLNVSDNYKRLRWSNVTYSITYIGQTNDRFYRYTSGSWQPLPIFNNTIVFSQNDIDDGLIKLYPHSQFLTECQTNCLVSSYNSTIVFSASDSWGRTLGPVVVPYAVVCCNSNSATVNMSSANVFQIVSYASNSSTTCSSARPGYYYDSPSGNFYACPLGTYNPVASFQAATDACISCPKGATTASTGSTSFSQCTCSSGNVCYNQKISGSNNVLPYYFSTESAIISRPQLYVMTASLAQYCGFRLESNAPNAVTTVDVQVSDQCNLVTYFYNGYAQTDFSVGLTSAYWNTTFYVFYNNSKVVSGALSSNVDIKNTQALKQLAKYLLTGNTGVWQTLTGFISSYTLPAPLSVGNVSILATAANGPGGSYVTQNIYDSFGFNMADFVDGILNPTATYLISNATADVTAVGYAKVLVPYYTFSKLTFTYLGGKYLANWLSFSGLQFDVSSSAGLLANYQAGFYMASTLGSSQLNPVNKFTGSDLLANRVFFIASPVLFSSNIAFGFAATHSDARFSYQIVSALTIALTAQYIAPPPSATPSQVSSSSSTASGSSSTPIGAIVGASVAAAFGVCFLVVIGLLIARRRRMNREHTTSPTSGSSELSGGLSKSFVGASASSLATSKTSGLNASHSTLANGMKVPTLPRSGSHSMIHTIRPSTPGSSTINKASLPHSSSQQSISYLSSSKSTSNSPGTVGSNRASTAASMRNDIPNITRTYFTPGQTVLAFPAFLEIDFDTGLTVGSKIAEGGFAVMYQGELVDDSVVSTQADDFSKYVAIKLFKLRSQELISGNNDSTVAPEQKDSASSIDSDVTGEMENEAAVLYALQNCPNIVKLVAVTKEPKLSIVMRLYDESLSVLLRKESSSLRDEALSAVKFSQLRLAAYFLTDIATGLHAIHNIGVAHLDIKPGNMLVERCADAESYKGFPYRVVICDFGLARIVNQVNAVKSKPRKLANGISTRYAAPEAFSVVRLIDQGSVITPKSFYKMDVFSFSSTAFEVLTRSVPFGSTPDGEIEVALLRNERPSIDYAKVPVYPNYPLSASDQELFELFASLITKGWLANPEIRPSMASQLDSCIEILEKI